uniref:hypothetical protein n=1 Tax=Paractinoplanes polyasparticus TaxID=2856853 RepID=UPI001C85FE1D|nr:hypothetical protein [Actinoplanes polyasparticus]
MNGWANLDRLLRTDPRDAGCGAVIELLDVYAELAVADPARARRRQPGIAAHLDACGPCEEDLAGLLAALTQEL